MTMFHDRATISGKARITREGYFVADALVARAENIQNYNAGELGLTDRAATDIVRVYRPEREVFAVDSLKSASRLPVTLDHPPVMVDAANWREYAKGETGEEILRDGEFMRVPIRVTDAAAVDSVQHDRQEFSLGYTAEIVLQSGVRDDGAVYDAIATNLRYNHLAACKSARGGPELRITDERTQGVQPVNAIVIDGFSVNLTDAAATGAALGKLLADRDSAVTDLGAARATIATRDAELATANSTIAARDAALAAATLTPAALRDAAAAHARTIADAKRMGATVTDEMDALAAQRAAVSARIGDRAANYDDAQVATAFDALAALLPADGAAAPVKDALGVVIGDTANVVDAQAAFDKARAARFTRLETGHRGAVKEA